jgi:cytochrome c-type biogenesis protein
VIEGLAAGLPALWLGILTSISPCPLATNIAAVSFIGRRLSHPGEVLFSGLLYTLGRTAAYTLIGVMLVAGMLNAPGISCVLQQHMNLILGPILVLAGIFMLDLLPLGRVGLADSEQARALLEKLGLWGALPLGFLFALAFCPTSAALFFGGLIPLAWSNNSPFFLPLLYGVGTALPVAAFAILIALGAGWVGKAFKILDRFEKWARYATGGIFIAVGLHLSLMMIFGINVLGVFP